MKLKTNLAIQDGYIVSYETKVAKIEKDKIVELGKFSNTTSRHIKLAAQYLNLPIQHSTQKQKFEKLPYGTKVI